MASGFEPEADPNHPQDSEKVLTKWRQWKTTGEIDMEVRQPLIFEVGRSGPFPLSFSEHHLFTSRNPREESFAQILQIGLRAICSLFLILLLLLPFSRPLRNVMFPFNRSLAGAGRRLTSRFIINATSFWIYVVIAILLILCIAYSHMHDDQEPFVLMEAISAWPTEILRALASILSITFCFATVAKLRDRNERIRRLYNLTVTRPHHETWSKKLSSDYHAILDAWFPPMSEPVSVADEWERAVARGLTWRRIERCAIALVLILCIYWLAPVGQRFTPIHVRGWIIYSTDIILKNLSFLLLVFLMLFVFDCSLLSYRFTTRLLTLLRNQDQWKSSTTLGWPEATLKATMDNRQIKQQYRKQLELVVSVFLTINLVDAVTRDVVALIYWPFVVLGDSHCFPERHFWKRSSRLRYRHVSAVYRLSCSFLRDNASSRCVASQG